LAFRGPDSCTIQVMTSDKDQSPSGTRQKGELRSFDITKWRQTTRCLSESPVHLVLTRLPRTSCNIYRNNSKCCGIMQLIKFTVFRTMLNQCGLKSHFSWSILSLLVDNEKVATS
jgi:hypothetical protein